MVGVDASEHAVCAVDWAADEAERFGGALTVVHALALRGLTGHLADVGYVERTRARLAKRLPNLRLDVCLSDLDAASALIG